MGRPAKLGPIIESLLLGPKRWSELLRETGLRRGTLSRNLKLLVSAGLVRRRVDASKTPPEVIYELNPDAIKGLFPSLFPRVSTASIFYLVRPVRPGEEGLKLFVEKVGLLTTFCLLSALAEEDVERAEGWLKMIGDELQKLLWLRELARLVSKGQLRIEIRVPCKMAVRKTADGRIVVKGLIPIEEYARAFKEGLLRAVPKRSVADALRALEEAYPEEVAVLRELTRIEGLLGKYQELMKEKKQPVDITPTGR